MGNHLEHLLSKHGVLISFSIAKKIDDNKIKELTDKIKGSAKNKIDFNNKLRLEIEEETTRSILNGNIPGLIVGGIIPKDADKSKQLIYSVNKTKLAELHTIASTFNKSVLNSKLTKNDICFIIYTILNFLEITDVDFKRFHDILMNGGDPNVGNDNEDEDDDRPYE